MHSLKYVGMAVPKIRETRAVYMQQEKMACNNNTMHLVGWGLHIVVVLLHAMLSCCIYTALVSHVCHGIVIYFTDFESFTTL